MTGEGHSPAAPAEESIPPGSSEEKFPYISVRFLFLLSIGVAHGSAAHTQPMVLVLDGSGSMWGKIENTIKIEIAKEAMGELIDGIPADFETGLMVYGHRVEGDCNDIEMVVPIGSHHADALKAKVQAVSPKAMPIPSGEIPPTLRLRGKLETMNYVTFTIRARK